MLKTRKASMNMDMNYKLKMSSIKTPKFQTTLNISLTLRIWATFKFQSSNPRCRRSSSQLWNKSQIMQHLHLKWLHQRLKQFSTSYNSNNWARLPVALKTRSLKALLPNKIRHHHHPKCNSSWAIINSLSNNRTSHSLITHFRFKTLHNSKTSLKWSTACQTEIQLTILLTTTQITFRIWCENDFRWWRCRICFF